MKYTTRALLILMGVATGTPALAFNAFVNCPDYIGNGFLCEAYPQGPGYQYLWETTGYTFLPHKWNPENFFISPSCYLGAGRLHVTVVSPDGTTASASTAVPSCENGFPY